MLLDPLKSVMPSVSGDSTTTPLMSPKLKRVSHPRIKKQSDDMSMSKFFKFTMMQREADRKDREERES